MRTSLSACLTAVLCLTASPASAQGRGPHNGQTSLPIRRAPVETLPAPSSKSHGHPPDTRSGTSLCGTNLARTPVNCATTPAPRPPTARSRNDLPQTQGSQSTTLPSGRGGQTPPHRRPLPTPWPFGIGVGAFAGLPLGSLTQRQEQQVSNQLSRLGPQLPESLRMSNFRITGLAKGGWPVVVDFEAEQGSYVLFTVVTQNAQGQTILPVPQTGRQLRLLRLSPEFGTTLKSGAFSLDATASATDTTPRYLRVYGFGAGPRAVGSVAIDELRFGPQTVNASQLETHFGFHTHTTFDKMKAEFMQVALVDNSIEGQLFDSKKLDRRVAEGESVNDQWSARKARSGQIQFRVRGWMTVRGDQGGDWVSAFSPDLVFKQ